MLTQTPQTLPLPTMTAPVKHPAKYSPDLLRVMRRYLQRGWLVYDPFGGVGGLHRLASATGAKTICGEIEYPVIANAIGTRSITANALYVPFANETFDAIATSPTYGNRMGDTYRPSDDIFYGADQAKRVWKRNTYSAHFGKNIHRDNTGGMNWGEAYRSVHRAAWQETWRVLKPNGLFILNISDHIRAGKRVYVSKWHLDTLRALGFQIMKTHAVKTPRLTFGANRERTACEYVFVFQKP